MRWVLFSWRLTTSGGLPCRGRERQERPSRCRSRRSVLRCGNHRDRILRRSFLKGACMDVPFQCELGGWGGSVLADLDQETRRPDRAGERFAQHMAQAGRSGPHDQPERRRGRFGQGRLAQQEQRVAGIAGAMMQPARRRQVEAGGVAARLQEHGARNRRARAACSAIHSASESLSACATSRRDGSMPYRKRMPGG